MKPILAADSIGKSFRGRRVLSSATLRLVPGELRVMFGRNGAGKSTLLKIAAGRIGQDTGVVHFRGEAFQSPNPTRMARLGLFYLPDHDLLSNAFTVRAQLEMIRSQFNGEDVFRSTERVGIAPLIDRRPGQLSNGELRRAELAAIFVRRPAVVLADEPYRGVTPKDAEALTAAFGDLARAGVAVIVTGHEVPTLLEAADHVTWCTDGTTYELGPSAAALKHERFNREYLGAAAGV